MSTAPFPSPVRPAIYPEIQHLPERLPGRATVNLTISRISKTHHGRTLQMLGHAAEYLVNSRRFLLEESSSAADEDAVRILMRLSSSVFREYAASVRIRRPVEDLVMGCMARLFE
jgi:hypothetical protein